MFKENVFKLKKNINFIMTVDEMGKVVISRVDEMGVDDLGSRRYGSRRNGSRPSGKLPINVTKKYNF